MSYQRHNRGMSNGGAVSSQDNVTPLSNAELKAAVPSLFATTAHDSRSERFVPIATIDIVDGLRKEGFKPFFAQQSKTRDVTRRDFTRHCIRMRHDGLTNGAGEAFEIILSNANDGSAAYQMLPGFFRFVCMNGLFIGEAFEAVKVRHSGNSVMDNVIEGAYTVLENAPRLTDMMNRYKGIDLSAPECDAFAEAAHTLRFPNAYDASENENAAPVLNAEKAPITAAALLRPRRSADSASDLWTTFNVVQENAIKGGQRGSIKGKNGRYRRASVRGVNGVAQNATLNRALMTLADRMAELKGVSA